MTDDFWTRKFAKVQQPIGLSLYSIPDYEQKDWQITGSRTLPYLI